jgi:hypothetical protein
MPRPKVKGMSKSEVIRLLGKPEKIEGPNEKNNTAFTYLMPSGSTKAAFYIIFENDIVVETHYDNSAWDAYEEEKAEK